MTARPRLLTFAHSHYCEKARWALDAAGVDYVEERHLPLLHRWHTRRVGGRSVPVLIAPDAVLTDSPDIVRYADGRGRRPLLPTAAAHRSDALELEKYLDRELGPHARRWAYAELLGSVAVLNRCVASGVAPVERSLTAAVMTVARPVIRRGFRITPESAARSLGRVREVFDRVGDRLADGRRFLVEGGFGAADLTFAALASPVLLPPEFGGAVPALAEVPAPMRAEVERCRATPAGRFALRLYAEHRRPA